MADHHDTGHPSAEEAAPVARIDSTVPHSARVWNWLLGGKDNYPVDRAAGEAYVAAFPGILDIARHDRAFLGRAVRHLVGEEGIRQLLDIGTGLPTMDNTHEVAQRTAPESRIVYVDNDPLVLTHAHALLTSTPEGHTDYIEEDLRNPAEILRKASATLDLGRPVAVMLLGIAHFVHDHDEIRSVLRTLMEGLPSGSFLVMTHATMDPELLGAQAQEAQSKAQEGIRERGATGLAFRTREQVTALFEGLEILEPGVVSMAHWRIEETSFGLPEPVAGYGVVGRKP
ncbi:SAM-dependent methyltransferase [Streptomyces sp. NPDC051940]|uniref:SAM-dependent methyltransferase n=1 Tax=Streptomyces sp. NPDC051940 TaxID=3155675 RepID=UPI00342411ED